MTEPEQASTVAQEVTVPPVRTPAAPEAPVNKLQKSKSHQPSKPTPKTAPPADPTNRKRLKSHLERWTF